MTYRRALLALLVAAALAGLSAQTRPDDNPHGPLPPGLDCVDCHTDEAWVPLRAPLAFDHDAQTRFPLTGSHAQARCTACHLDLRFDAPRLSADDCGSCHVDVHQGAFAAPCVACHTTQRFDEVDGVLLHAQTRFPLTGAHVQLMCESCHRDDRGGAFTPLETDCIACHQADYEATRTVDHTALGFPEDCTNCHTTLAWTDAGFDHATLANGYDLTGPHAALPCTRCHTPPGLDLLFTPADQEDCYACHEQDYTQQHEGSGFPTTCLECHTAERWEDAVFDHAALANGFALVGAHAPLACASCHVIPGYALLWSPAGPDDCYSCHEPDYAAAHAADGFPVTCLACHTTQAWAGAVFDHAAAANGFDLTGVHAPLPCASCHVVPGYDVLWSPAGPDDCYACHEQDYAAEHTGSGFPTTCLDCHVVGRWEDATFEHAAVANGFALVGAHRPLSCEGCHVLPGMALIFSPMNQDDCLACHEQDFTDEHAGSGFPTTCRACHTVDAWERGAFEHAAVTNGFVLEGAHAPLPCEHCHVLPGLDLLFTPADQDDCYACHEQEYATEHTGSGFPTTCRMCHTVDRWEDAAFDHALAANGFALEGAHTPLRCEACHVLPGLDLLFRPVDQNDCLACHEQAYAEEHTGSGFPTTCLTCHTTDRWEDPVFDHASSSNGYSLVGAHAPLACDRCHVLPGLDLRFTPLDQDDCLACHEQEYATEHAGSGFPTTCLTCHNVDAWEGTVFDHAAAGNGFALLGAHAPLPCERCHVLPGLDLLFTPSGQDDCYACHEPDYAAQHAGTTFSTTCLDCHNQDRWTEPVFDHAAYTGGYALLGAHAPLPCASCHVIPGYALLWSPADQEDCYACHEQDYTQQHEGSGFPTTCLECHTAERWEDAVFDHAALANGFALVGAHAPLACASCHVIPGYALLWSPAGQDDCYTCHERAYQAEHAGSGFPTTCLACHATTTWTGATFDHDGLYFPIYSGEHRDEWDACGDCHLAAPSDFQSFSCLNCHAHRQSAMDDEHSDVNGYVYDSLQCLSCHPNGSEDDD